MPLRRPRAAPGVIPYTGTRATGKGRRVQDSPKSSVGSGWAAVLVVAAWSIGSARGDDPPVDGLDVFSATAKEIEHGGPAHLTGVVTFRDDQPERNRTALVVQRDRAAVWVITPLDDAAADDPRPLADDIVPGSRVRVEGTLDAGSYAPRVLATSVILEEQGPLPAPLTAEESGVFRGAGGAVRTALEGIVQSVRRDKGVYTLAIDADGRRVTVRSARPPAPGIADQLIDSRVRLNGVAAAIRNSRGQFLGPVLVINGFEDVERLEAPSSSAFDARFVPLDQIARFGSPTLDGHRFQTEGIVSRAVPTRYLYLQDGTVGIRVETGDREVYKPGDRVRVSGFIDMGRQLRGVTGAVTRRVEPGPPPEPLVLEADAIVKPTAASKRQGPAFPGTDYGGRLVKVAATIADAGSTRDGGVLRLASGKTILEAILLPEAYEAVARLEPGSEVAVTGVVQYDVARSHEELVDGRLTPFERFTLVVHSADDIAVLRAAPWWTPVRLTGALVAVLTVLAAALAWAWSLRRQVAFQAAAIGKEMRARREAAVEFQATLRERTRLAANLHDTLLQTLAGIGFQLEACQMSAERRGGGSSAGESAEHLDVARRMVDHAVDDIRGSVWALRSAAVHGQSLTEAIDSAISRVGTGHRARITARAVGEPFDLPNFVTGNLLLIVQEAIFNALRHGDPDTVDVVVSFDAPHATVELSVHDDGAGFTLGHQLGPAEGHFGLQGMRERAERLGGRLTIESRPGGGTTVRCHVRCRDYDPDMEHDAHPPVAPPPLSTPA